MYKVKKGLNVDITLTRDDKEVDFTQKPAKCQFHATHKLNDVDFRSKWVKMLISR